MNLDTQPNQEKQEENLRLGGRVGTNSGKVELSPPSKGMHQECCGVDDIWGKKPDRVHVM